VLYVLESYHICEDNDICFNHSQSEAEEEEEEEEDVDNGEVNIVSS
jgi:aryl-phospho-beta-D-glucosidase BglC (GH1 family)